MIRATLEMIVRILIFGFIITDWTLFLNREDGFSKDWKVEVDSSFSSIEYSVSFSEDEKALNEIVAELSTILETLRMLLESNQEKINRNRLPLTLVELKSDFKCKVTEFRRVSLRAISSSPQTLVSDYVVASTEVFSDSEKIIHPEPSVSVRTQADYVAKWNLRYS
ncbi:hypothetical protein FQA39_LY08910 [Lamprigera yunnana]|nr:hypothetical protein FQA39_LY08910 [Lamprigera yunnana]